ncbi:hypothetical protein CAPTEDRAFT_222851 [Capitella teleta]|uniref:Tetraspanin n=1 Tax=Capitella teleta TaxID=283909 RepID=R7U547_CAPTE|nr:hypothetical protein CAPTEDRAFT_222851 [Capitella teleta]|eukprot:ELU01470.1 hypothetical protein CAPTEDRAFT_222851 [Capitella teleta]
MGLSCGSKCAKYTLFGFNLLFWLAGAVMMGIGIWFLVDENALSYLNIAKTSDGLVKASSITIVTVGSVVFVTGFLGCCGAIRESPCMLTMYACVLSVLLILEIIAGILAIVFRNDIQRNLEKSMNDTVNSYYGDPDHAGDTEAWDFTQKSLKCCGSKGGPADWENSAWKALNPNKNVPDTCCVLVDINAKVPTPVNVTMCNLAAKESNPSNEFLHSEGCSDALSDWIDSHSAILIGVAFGVACLQMFAIIFACCTKSSLKSQYEYI